MRGGGRDGDYFFPSSAPLSISHRSSSHPEQDFFPEDMAASDWAVYCKVDVFIFFVLSVLLSVSLYFIQEVQPPPPPLPPPASSRSVCEGM